MAIPAVLALGARVGMPVAKELVKKYGPGIFDAVASTGIGAFIGDKLFSKRVDTGEGIYSGPDADEIEKRKREEEEIIKKGGITPIPEQEKFTGNVTTIPNIDELTGKPLITPIPEKIDTSSVTPIPEQKSFDDYIMTMTNNLEELKEKVKSVDDAKKDSSLISITEKANKGFYKLSEKEKSDLASQFSEIVYDPVKKKALYELLSPQGKKVLSEYAKEKEYITGEQLKKLDTEQREYNEKSLKKDQAIINAYNNILTWKETELGKTDLTGRTLSGQRLADVMAGDDEYAKKLFSERAARNRVIQFLKPDLDEIGLTEIASVGSSVKVTEGKPAQQLLQELELSYFPKNFDFISKGALNSEQKLVFDQAVTKVRSAMKEQDSDVSGDIGRAWLRTNTNRMIRYAYDNNIPLDQVIEKVESFDADGIADILTRKEKHNKKIKEFKELGYDVDFAEVGHIKAAMEDALLSLDLDNLTLQNAKSNRQEDVLRNQIKDVIKNGKNSKYNINDIIAQLEYLGIKTKIGEDVYGKEIDVEKELRNLEIGASDAIFGIPYSKGGIVGISHLTRPL